MNRELIIRHLADVALSVLRADAVVKPQWEERLRQTRNADQETKERMADEYLRAVAEEMLKAYSDSDLQRLYGEEETNQND